MTKTKSIRHILTLILIGISSLLPAITLSQEVISIDKIIAIVDGDVVLQSEYDMRWSQVQEQMANMEGPRPDVVELKKQLLDQLILENLQMQMASRAGVRVNDN